MPERDSEERLSTITTSTNNIVRAASPDSARSIVSAQKWLSVPQLSTLQKDIIKCATAYLIGSLFTFVPYFASLISDMVPNHGSTGPSPAGHMVATVTVYFNPAKTLGAMQEADVYCLIAALFSAFVALGSMDTFWFFEIKPGWEWLADALTFMWIAAAMSIVAWVKQWMNKPSFSPAASMASIIIFITVVKEGGLHILLQVSFIVLIGSIISNLVCILIWPRSATTALQRDMCRSLNSFATLLQILTMAFLLEEDLHSNSETLLQAIRDHQASFTSLKKSRDEAKSEWWNPRIQRPSDAYDAAVDSMTRLAQHISGLRSGLRLEVEMSLARHELTGLSNVDPDTQNAVVEKEFAQLVDELGPPMSALASTCVRILTTLRESFTAHIASLATPPRAELHHDYDELSSEIGRALFTVERTSNYALARLFERERNKSVGGSRVTEQDPMFLFYFFLFTLQEFARELQVLTEAMGIIHQIEHSAIGWTGWFISWLPPNYGPNKNAPKASKLFPPVKPHAPNTILRPSHLSLPMWGRVKQTIWSFFQRLREPDTVYAIKTGTGTAILALPAFIDSTRPWFLEYRGEWALISFFVVMSKTIGATNVMGLHRILGTLCVTGSSHLGTISTLFPEKPILLAAFGFFFSMPCFYVIITMPPYATSGRFVLLAYNLTTLFCYNLRFEDQAVWQIALYRSCAVTIGVVWALIVSRWWWPSEARRELTNGLSEFCLNIGWLYTALVKMNSQSGEIPDPHAHQRIGSEDVEDVQLLPTIHASEALFMEMELHLQLKLLELQGLLVQAGNEPRLKGPFPVTFYRNILTSLQNILDKLHSMRCGKTNFIRAVNKERREMVGNVILYCSVLSAAFGSKSPLSPYLPPAEQARQRLVDALRRFDMTESMEGHESRQLLYVAYALMMKGVISELDSVGHSLQEAFGVVGYHGPQDFDSIFETDGTGSDTSSPRV
ncbi:Fusaric acid resistance protein-like-domain-containing protein [Cantharellus anzutake]|uniref:Fusaric acid resistance protein-like-domain-containing protein n=1 Tax=Cantharellus anzutake TaxID=1750568 RepID=UPI001908CB14|nr:Fusaric acid resistance protein-like-domain-containing protein [Cantharellus anzutake]KAF8325195.1 Fusaric acid resistance protein-like-domain-containing protein [Cantharellus anzutake]